MCSDTILRFRFTVRTPSPGVSYIIDEHSFSSIKYLHKFYKLFSRHESNNNDAEPIPPEMWTNNIPKHDSKTAAMEICATPKDHFSWAARGQKALFEPKLVENHPAPASFMCL